MSRFIVALVACLCLIGVPVRTHEIGGASVAIVVRAGGEADVRLVIPYEEVLHRQVMPAQPFEAFLAAFSSAPAGQTSAATSALQAMIVRETRLVADGRSVAIDHWMWPPAAIVRDTLRRALMMQTVGHHEHPDRLVVVAAAHLDASAHRLQVRVPAVLGPVLVTVSRPQEQWVGPGALSVPFTLQ